MLKVAVAGSQGKMGRALIKVLKNADDVLLTALTVSSEESIKHFDQQDLLITPTHDLATVIDSFDVLIDFTSPLATLSHLTHCISHRKAMVIGTTGLTADHKVMIQRASQDIPIVLAPNTSIGMNVCLALVQKAAQLVGKDADIEILEAHHAEKKDAPSGTALQIGEIIAASLQHGLDDLAVYDRRGAGPRTPGSIGISSIRARDIVGEHKVLFALQGESFEITHKAIDRQAFANGAVIAAKWLGQQPAGLYSMRDVLGL